MSFEHETEYQPKTEFLRQFISWHVRYKVPTLRVKNCFRKRIFVVFRNISRSNCMYFFLYLGNVQICHIYFGTIKPLKLFSFNILTHEFKKRINRKFAKPSSILCTVRCAYQIYCEFFFVAFSILLSVFTYISWHFFWLFLFWVTFSILVLGLHKKRCLPTTIQGKNPGPLLGSFPFVICHLWISMTALETCLSCVFLALGWFCVKNLRSNELESFLLRTHRGFVFVKIVSLWSKNTVMPFSPIIKLWRKILWAIKYLSADCGKLITAHQTLHY